MDGRFMELTLSIIWYMADINLYLDVLGSQKTKLFVEMIIVSFERM